VAIPVAGMYVWGDLKRDVNNKDKFSLDDEGHFLVAAAIGLGKDDVARAELLVANGCRVLVLDSSHGACKPGASSTLNAYTHAPFVAHISLLNGDSQGTDQSDQGQVGRQRGDYRRQHRLVRLGHVSS
jgi:hypothetical protein